MIRRLTISTIIALILPVFQAIGATSCADTTVCIDSLSELTVEELRKHHYDSQYELLKDVSDKSRQASSLMAGYTSGRLNLYMRVDLPSTPAPPSGYPIVVLAPGWISRTDAPIWDFGLSGESFTQRTISAFVARGFTVITAGYRGRGTIDDVPADGLEFRDAWGNGSYLSPIFYSIDVLNLIAGLQGLENLPWSAVLIQPRQNLQFDLSKVALMGHSQGGDVALNTLAVLGDNSAYPQTLVGASIWAGNIPDRFTQANTFGPMGSTLQAFMSGDGTWTGTAVGKDGSINPDFVFAWPADWIETLDTQSAEWTWQAESWATPSVRDALKKKYQEMYATVNRYVRNQSALGFSLDRDELGATVVTHHPTVARLMPAIGGFNYPRYVGATPLYLHISDRDFYSIPDWNKMLANRVTATGGKARVFIYPGNTHALLASKYRWFSPAGTMDGAPLAVERDAILFQSGQPHRVAVQSK